MLQPECPHYESCAAATPNATNGSYGPFVSRDTWGGFRSIAASGANGCQADKAAVQGTALIVDLWPKATIAHRAAKIRLMKN
jgi:hypothetical protein